MTKLILGTESGKSRWDLGMVWNLELGLLAPHAIGPLVTEPRA